MSEAHKFIRKILAGSGATRLDIANEKIADLEAQLAERDREIERLRGDDIWLIFFEEADVKSEIFSGEGCENVAKKRFEQCSISWSCYLFQGRAHSIKALSTTEGEG